MLRSGNAAALILAAAFFCSLPAWSASLHVSPVRLDLGPDTTRTVITLRNGGEDAVLVQAEPVSWAQEDGQDVYAPTRDLLVSPPVFTIPAGGSQILRVGLRRPPDPRQELSYRLYLQEVPGAPKPGEKAVQMALRLGLPVFVSPPDAKPRLEWHAVQMPDGQVRLTLENTGNAHVQLTGFSLTLPDSEAPLATEATPAYLLAGEGRSWVLAPKGKLPAGIATLRITGKSDAGHVDQILPLETR